LTHNQYLGPGTGEFGIPPTQLVDLLIHHLPKGRRFWAHESHRRSRWMVHT